MDVLGLISRYLPVTQALAFLRVLPIATKILAIIAQIDADHDGQLSGAEKLQAATKVAATIVTDGVGIPAEKIRGIVQAGVDFLNAIKAVI